MPSLGTKLTLPKQNSGVPRSAALVAAAAPWGGIEEHVLTLAQELHLRGIRFSVVVGRGSRLDAAFRFAGINVVRCPLLRFDSRGPAFRRSLRKPLLYRALLLLWVGAVCLVGRHRIVVCHKLWDADALLPLQWLGGVSIVLHESTHRVPPVEILRVVDRVACMSAAVRRHVAQLLPPSASPVFFPPLFRPKIRELLPEQRREYMTELLGDPYDPGAPVVTVLASLVEFKGHEHFLKSLQASGVFSRQRFVVVCAGEGPLRGRLEAVVRESGLTGRVFFPGFVADVGPLLASSTVALLPSPEEGFGIALLEAALVGLPIVLSRSGGAADVFVRHGETGLLFDPQVPGSIVDCLETLLGDPGLRSKLGEGARQVARTEFSAERGVERFLQLLESAPSRARAAQE